MSNGTLGSVRWEQGVHNNIALLNFSISNIWIDRNFLQYVGLPLVCKISMSEIEDTCYIGGIDVRVKKGVFFCVGRYDDEVRGERNKVLLLDAYTSV